MENFVKEFLLIANGKALATNGPNGLNVIPVSTIFIEGDNIVLVDYFMQKTLQNILENKNVSLAAWKDLYGYQIKAECEYKIDGEIFENTVLKVKEILPDRVVKGVLILSVKEVFDIAPTKNTKEHFLLKL